MPNPLNTVACGDNYTDAATIKDVFQSGGGAFQIQNQPVFFKCQYGGQGVDAWTEEQQLGVGGGPVPPNVTGVAFRNAVAGKTATVSAFIVPKGQPSLSLAFPGAVASALIKGQVNSDGSIHNSDGSFSVVKSGAGQYDITFTTAFAVAPTVVASPVITGQPTRAAIIDAFALTTGVRIMTSTPTVGFADTAFNFIAQS